MKVSIYISLLCVLLLTTGCLKSEDALKKEKINQSKSNYEQVAKEAIAQSNPELCINLDDEIMLPPTKKEKEGKGANTYIHPKNECLSIYTKTTSDVQGCKLMSKNTSRDGYKYDDCMINMAEVWSDLSLCEEIQYRPQWKSVVICKAIATLDINQCYTFNQGTLDALDYSPIADCIQEVVARTYEYEYCFDIDEPGYFMLGEDATDRTINTCLWGAACNNPDKEQVDRICSLSTDENPIDGCMQSDFSYCFTYPERVKKP
jgi:hypothetical protein